LAARVGVIGNGSLTYFYVYFFCDIVLALLEFFVFYELFIHRQFPRFYQVRFYRLLFPLALAATVLAAVLTSFTVLHIIPVRQAAAILFAVRVLQSSKAVMLLFFTALILLMGRQWIEYDFGIALGFGISSVGAVMNSAVWARTGYVKFAMPAWLEPLIYNIACTIWFIYVLKPIKRTMPRVIEPLSPEVLEQAHEWEKTLKDWLTNKRHAG